MKQMTHGIICALTIFCLTPLRAQHMWQIGDGKAVHWYYMDGDEFTADSLNTAKWENAYPWGRSLYCANEPHYYTDGTNLFLQNGVISLEARKEKVRAKAVPYDPEDHDLKCNGKSIGKKNLMDFSYTAGMIFSKKKYTYGYYEIRFRSDEGLGLWPAFWLYAGKDNFEIDAFEIVGGRNEDFHVDMHCPSGCNNYKTFMGLVKKNWGGYVGTTANWKDGYNVIGVEWQPTYIKWYLNGQPTAYWKGKYEHPSWVIADIAVTHDGGPFGPGPDSATRFPARFDIDYIRMWSSSPVSDQPITTLEGFSDPLSPRPATLKPGTAAMKKKSRPEYNKKALSGNSIFVSLGVSEGGKWLLSVTGNPQRDFRVSVTGASGKVLYESRDITLKEHYFDALVAGEKHLLTIINGGEEVSYPF